MYNGLTFMDEFGNLYEEDMLMQNVKDDNQDVSFCTPLAEFEHEEIIEDTQLDDSVNFSSVFAIENNVTEEIVDNCAPQNTNQLLLSPETNKRWEIQREDIFLTEVGSENYLTGAANIDSYNQPYTAAGDLPNLSLEQIFLQDNGNDQMLAGDATAAVENDVWAEYSLSDISNLNDANLTMEQNENNDGSVIYTLNLEDEIQMPMEEGGGNNMELHYDDTATVAILQGSDALNDNDLVLYNCNYCNQTFTLRDLASHIGEHQDTASIITEVDLQSHIENNTSVIFEQLVSGNELNAVPEQVIGDSASDPTYIQSSNNYIVEEPMNIEEMEVEILQEKEDFDSGTRLQEIELTKSASKSILVAKLCELIGNDIENNKEKYMNGLGLYRCSKCLCLFQYKKDLLLHLLTHKQSIITCNKCESIFIEKDAFFEHSKTHISLQCHYCLKDVVGVDDYSNHMNMHYKQGDIMANQGTKQGDIMANQGTKQGDIMANQGTKQGDVMANQETKQGDIMANQGTKQGDIMANQGTKQGDIMANQGTKQGDGENKMQDKGGENGCKQNQQGAFHCKLCIRQFRRIQDLKNHKRYHFREKSYRCNFCSVSIENMEDFNAHVREHAITVENMQKEGKNPFVCYQCGEILANIDQLSAHMETHIPKGSYLCDQCKLCFRHKETFRSHMRGHSLQTPSAETETAPSADQPKTRKKLCKDVICKKVVRCNFCPQSFTNQAEKNRHLKTHENDNSSNIAIDTSFCIYCSVKLETIPDVIHHIRKHTDERKLFPCSICDRKLVIERRQNSVEPAIAYYCTFCTGRLTTSQIDIVQKKM